MQRNTFDEVQAAVGDLLAADWSYLSDTPDSDVRHLPAAELFQWLIQDLIVGWVVGVASNIFVMNLYRNEDEKRLDDLRETLHKLEENTRIRSTAAESETLAKDILSDLITVCDPNALVKAHNAASDKLQRQISGLLHSKGWPEAKPTSVHTKLLSSSTSGCERSPRDEHPIATICL